MASNRRGYSRKRRPPDEIDTDTSSTVANESREPSPPLRLPQYDVAAEDDPGPFDDIVPDSDDEDIGNITSAISNLAPATKRRRRDVTARHEANANTDVSIVKTTLKSFCTKRAMILPWETVLKDMNKMMTEAYVLANVHVVRLCQIGLPVEPLELNFYHQCLSAVSSGSLLGSKQFRASIALYNKWRGTNVERTNNSRICRGWQHNAARQMKTNSDNAVKLNFYRRFHKQIKRCYDINGNEAYTMLNSILAPVYEGNDDEVLAWREHIPRKSNGYLNDETHLLLPLTYTFLSDIEEWNRRNRENPDIEEIRVFSLLPTKKGFECSHFTMCKLGLRALLQRAGMRPPAEGKNWNAVSDWWWRFLFNIKKFETRTRKFAGQILTDGKAVSIVMRKPKQVVFEEPMDEKDYDVRWVWIRVGKTFLWRRISSVRRFRAQLVSSTKTPTTLRATKKQRSGKIIVQTF